MGCGSGGSYLYRLLRRRNPDSDITLFDPPTANACGIKCCAWGVSRPLFSKLCAEAGVNSEQFVISRYDHVVINGQRLKADLAIINKPALVKNFLGDAQPLDPGTADVSVFDRIIDATGSERAFMPPTDAQPVVSAVQVRLKARAPDAPTAVFNPGGGYSWLFPIGADEVHLGSLSPGGFDKAREELKKMMSGSKSKVVCSCRGKIRCHGPILPLNAGSVWGIGESIGLVDPVTGAGIIPAMTSAKMLVDHWDSPGEYQADVLQRFSYMIKEANILNRLMAGNPLSSGDLFFPKQALETIGISPSLAEFVGLVVKGARDYLAHRRA
ncbi:Dehydrogenase (flavoprotein) [Dehalogenimonas formicexedens]|uniref:Dehydrogenase (Flavoprotein) n=2 Tax=Dehalogenimonas formicexedens TaxID=1839801 RepID=A0A1P8F676_9CHLR|nr:Dehydrogenase (flavoprotein) [Dehalogenimonas formicexedens]